METVALDDTGHANVNVVTMLAPTKGDYCEELLSSRLQGGAIKKALAITLLLKFKVVLRVPHIHRA